MTYVTDHTGVSSRIEHGSYMTGRVTSFFKAQKELGNTEQAILMQFRTA